MSVVNTRTTMGEQVTLDALIAHSLAELIDDGVTELGQYALYKQENLEHVNFPVCSSIGSYAMQDCVKLTKVEIGAKTSIGSSAFRGCTLLKSLILSGSTASTLSSYDTLASTNFAKCNGGIYVPNNLVDTYKSTQNWMPYRHLIFPDSDFPRTSYATITDSWTDIVAASANGTYSSKYKVGDTALMTINGTSYLFMLVAKDKDVKADDSGTANMTWLLVGMYNTHRMNASNVTTDGWEGCEMRTWLSGTVMPLMPSEVQAALVEVKKPYFDYDSSSTKVCSDKIWIPSSYEVCLTGGYLKEDSGVQYSDVFTTNQYSRVKFDTNGSAGSWWLRSASSGASFVYVASSGGGSYYSATIAIGVVFGFCI